MGNTKSVPPKTLTPTDLAIISKNANVRLKAARIQAEKEKTYIKSYAYFKSVVEPICHSFDFNKLVGLARQGKYEYTLDSNVSNMFGWRKYSAKFVNEFNVEHECPYCLVQQRDKYPYRLAWSWKPEDIEQLNELRKQHVESVRAQDVSTNQDVPLAHIVNEL